MKKHIVRLSFYVHNKNISFEIHFIVVCEQIIHLMHGERQGDFHFKHLNSFLYVL